MRSRRQWMQGLWLPKAFVSSGGIWNLPITSLPVDSYNDRALWCKSTGINYSMHGWILCRYCATGWFWWISGVWAVGMWSSSSFTKSICPIAKRSYVFVRRQGRSGYGLSQWETTLPCNVVSHWLSHTQKYPCVGIWYQDATTGL